MQERNGIKPKKSKEERKREKEERKQLKHERKQRRIRSSSHDDRRSDRRSPSYDDYDDYRRSPAPYTRPSRSPIRSSSRSVNGRRYDDSSPRRVRHSWSPEQYRRRSRSRSRSPVRDGRMPPGKHMWPRSDESDDDYSSGRARERVAPPAVNGKRYRSRSPRDDRGSGSKRYRPSSPRLHEPSQRTDTAAEDRAARLAAMSSNATAMSSERQARLAALLEKEKAELAVEEQARARSKGMGGFLSHEQKKVFGGSGGLEERIRRGRGGMVVDND